MRCSISLHYVFASVIAAILLPRQTTVAAEPQASPKTVRAAAIQFISQFAKPAENRKALEPLIREAARNGAKIVVLPETAISGYMSHDITTTWQVGNRPLSAGLQGISPKAVAETVPGESTQAFAALAKELGIYLTVPLIEYDAKQDKYFNTLVLVDPEGKIALHYRKLNPWPWAERGWAAKGDRGLQFIDTPYGRLGLLVCYDINFEPNKLRRKGMDHLLYSIAWVDEAKSTWFARELPEIAKRANFNIIGANWSVPNKPAWHGYGQSLIIRRDGRVAAKVKSDLGNEIVYSDLSVPAAATWESMPADQVLKCTISCEEKCELGKVPQVKVSITNLTKAEIYLVGSLDGSESQMRYPNCFFEITGPDGNSALHGITRIDNYLNTLREKDFVKVPPGGTFDPYQRTNGGGFFHAAHLNEQTFSTTGEYRIRFVYVASSDDIANWAGDGVDRVAADRNLLSLFKKVPKVAIESNEIKVSITDPAK